VRLEVICENRLGIAREILALLASFDLNLRAIDADQTGRIYVHFPKLEFSDFQLLMLNIRKIDGVNDVRRVPHLPSEQEHYGLLTLLKTIPDPIFSIDAKGQITRANEAGISLLQCQDQVLIASSLQQWVSGFSFSKWLSTADVTPQVCKVTVATIEYLAEIMPVYFSDGEEEADILTGAVVILKSSVRIGKQYNALNQRSHPTNGSDSFRSVIAKSGAMKTIVKQAEIFAARQAPILIQGQTGSGKQLLARACHAASSRHDKPFLVLNCANLSPLTTEQELFGQSSPNQSFAQDVSSAAQGLLAQCEGGTLYLNQISELSLSQQVMLLGLLETGMYRAVGSSVEKMADIRIICSSQQDLAQLCHTGAMREDFYYRINGLCLNLLPLNQRRKDILGLAEHFVEIYSQQLSSTVVRLSQPCREHLLNYGWPGNVRQLKQAIYSGISLADNTFELTVEHLSLPSFNQAFGYFDDSFEGTLDQATKQFEADILRRLYPAYPSTRLLAKKLGISHTAIANKLREHGIAKKRDSEAL